MEPNYRFVIDQAKALGGPDARILDYGCGAGEIVKAGLAEGLNIVGADMFYGGNAERAVRKDAILNGNIFEIRNGNLPFPDNSFDVVAANMVFEHVADLDTALDEVRRVLKPGGAFLNIFPTIGVLREGHCGVPFAHWLNRAPRMQRAWLLAARTMGLGHFKSGKTKRQWANDFSDWLRAFTAYRSMGVIRRAYSRRFAKMEALEPEYIAFRLELRGWRKLGSAVRTWVRWPATVASRRLATMVLVAH